MENWRTTNDDIGYCTSLAALHRHVTFPRDRCFQGYPTCTFDEKLAGQSLSGDRISCLGREDSRRSKKSILSSQEKGKLHDTEDSLLPRHFSSETGAMGML